MEITRCMNGEPRPKLIYGTAIRHEIHPATELALECGYRGIDTAGTSKYHNEHKDGQALRQCLMTSARETLWVQTKYSPPLLQSDPWPYSPTDALRTQILKSYVRSMTALGVSCLDAYLLHTPIYTIESTLKAWTTLEQIVQHGGTRYLGIANVELPVLQALMEQSQIRPSLVQNWFRKSKAYDRDVVLYCRDHGIQYQLFGLFDAENQWLLHCAPVTQLVESRHCSMQSALIQTMLEVATNIQLHLSILIGSTSTDHMKENLSAISSDHKTPAAELEQLIELIGWV